jgi:hypothetical protein
MLVDSSFSLYWRSVNPELITKSILMLQTYIRTSIRSAFTLLLLLHADSLVVLAPPCRITLGSSGSVFWGAVLSAIFAQPCCSTPSSRPFVYSCNYWYCDCFLYVYVFVTYWYLSGYSFLITGVLFVFNFVFCFFVPVTLDICYILLYRGIIWQQLSACLGLRTCSEA